MHNIDQKLKMFFINDLGFFWRLKCIFSDKFNFECSIITITNNVGNNASKKIFYLTYDSKKSTSCQSNSVSQVLSWGKRQSDII